MRRVVPLVAVAMIAAACASARSNDPVFRPRPNYPLPYSEAVHAGGLVFVAGIIGADSAGKLVPGGITAETRQAMESIRAVLARNDLGLERVVKCQVFLADAADFAAMNAVYSTFFPGTKPARTTIGGAMIPGNARIEVDCIAAAR